MRGKKWERTSGQVWVRKEIGKLKPIQDKGFTEGEETLPIPWTTIEGLENYSGKPEKSETVENDRIFHIFSSFPFDNNFSEWEQDDD